MIELHCWITIRADYNSDNECNENVLRLIKNELDTHHYNSIEIKAMNGEYYIEFSLYANHFSQDTKELLHLFVYIGRIAVGSYGLLYLHNDESDTSGNSFRIYSLAKGVVNVHDDPFLSPCIPTIEE